MKKGISVFTFLNRFLALIAAPITFYGVFFALGPLRAQLTGPYETPQEREFYNDGSGSGDQGTILDATNPMDMLNRLRRAKAMDNATNPSDAIDQALEALDAQQLGNTSLELDKP